MRALRTVRMVSSVTPACAFEFIEEEILTMRTPVLGACGLQRPM